MNQAAGMENSARAKTVPKGISGTYARWNRSMAIRSHVKSGEDLEQEKPAVYHEYSDRDCFRDFKRIENDILDGSWKLPLHLANGSRSDFKRAGIFKMYGIEDVFIIVFCQRIVWNLKLHF